MRRLAPLLFLAASSLFAANPSRDELLKNPKYAEAKAPRFETFTPESLRYAVKVSSRRSYAAFGFNDREMQLDEQIELDKGVSQRQAKAGLRRRLAR